jgi:hypothetical protein
MVIALSFALRGEKSSKRKMVAAAGVEAQTRLNRLTRQVQ